MSGEEDESAELLVAKAGDPDHTRIAEMCEYLREASAMLLNDDPDRLKAHSLMMTAACTFSGIIFGSLLSAGIAREQDKKRAAEMAASNFRTGIDIGKRRAARILTEQCEGSA